MAACVTRQQAQKLGSLMSQWHGSMGDPIYAVGSYLIDGQIHPSLDTIRSAAAGIRRMIPQAEIGHAGWGKREARELKRIASGLKRVEACARARGG